MNDNIIDKPNAAKLNFLKATAERSFYLDEFKENIILALTDKQIMSGIIYQEAIVEMKKETTARVKMRRDIPLKSLQPYIMAAEKIGLQYTLVDALDTQGDIGLVVVSKEAFDDDKRQIVVEDLEEKFEKVGLNKEYIRKLGAKLCKKHYKLLVEKMPTYKDQFEELTLFDRLFGKECPICKVEREKN